MPDRTSVSTSDARGPSPAPSLRSVALRANGDRPLPTFDASFARWFAALCGLVPLAVLGWDALHGQLGVNGVNHALRTTGLLGLVCLMLTLAITPLR